YEMIWDLLNFALLMWLGRQKRLRLVEGDLIWVYIVVYSIGRFAIESIRVDSSTVNGIPIPQIIALLSILLAWAMFLIRHRPGSMAPLSETNLPPEMLLQMTQNSKSRPSRVRKVRSVVAQAEPDDA